MVYSLSRTPTLHPPDPQPGSSLSAGGPSGSSEESGKSSPNPAIIYENTTVEDVPKPMPRKKSTKAMEKSAGGGYT